MMTMKNGKINGAKVEFHLTSIPFIRDMKCAGECYAMEKKGESHDERSGRNPVAAP